MGHAGGIEQTLEYLQDEDTRERIRRTYEEFLRRAEQKLVESAVEYMYH